MDLIRTLPLKGRVEMDIPMKELTTLRVGGKADCVVFAGSERNSSLCSVPTAMCR